MTAGITTLAAEQLAELARLQQVEERIGGLAIRWARVSLEHEPHLTELLDAWDGGTDEQVWDPRRVKVEGDLFHGRIPAGAVYVGRPAPGLDRSPFHNPHALGKPCKPCGGTVHDVAECRALFRAHLDANPALVDQARRELPGSDLACWCPMDAEWCHAEEWLALVNAKEAA